MEARFRHDRLNRGPLTGVSALVASRYSPRPKRVRLCGSATAWRTTAAIRALQLDRSNGQPAPSDGRARRCPDHARRRPRPGQRCRGASRKCRRSRAAAPPGTGERGRWTPESRGRRRESSRHKGRPASPADAGSEACEQIRTSRSRSKVINPPALGAADLDERWRWRRSASSWRRTRRQPLLADESSSQASARACSPNFVAASATASCGTLNQRCWCSPILERIRLWRRRLSETDRGRGLLLRSPAALSPSRAINCRRCGCVMGAGARSAGRCRGSSGRARRAWAGRSHSAGLAILPTSRRHDRSSLSWIRTSRPGPGAAGRTAHRGHGGEARTRLDRSVDTTANA